MSRPKGSQNKKTVGKIMAQRDGITPIEFLLSVMDDEDNAIGIRIDAAKSAAPYCHARLANVVMEHTSELAITKIEEIIVDPKNTDS